MSHFSHNNGKASLQTQSGAAVKSQWFQHQHTSVLTSY